jgi:hypothetical protein
MLTIKSSRLLSALLLLAGAQPMPAAPDKVVAPFEAPAFELAADSPLEPIPLRWVNGWVLARIKINGADAGWFKFASVVAAGAKLDANHPVKKTTALEVALSMRDPVMVELLVTHPGPR